MKTKLLVLFVILTSGAVGHSVKSPDQIPVSYAQNAIFLFQHKTGRLPESWSDLRKINESNRFVRMLECFKIEGLNNEFIVNFRFIPKNTSIRIRGKTEKVVAMGTHSMILPTSHSYPKYRLLIIQEKRGGIVVKKYTEDSLSKLFEMAGFDLFDYTGMDGKWQPEINDDRGGDIPKVEGGADIHNNLNDENQPLIPNNVSENNKLDSEVKTGNKTDYKPYPAWLLFIIILGFVCWMIIEVMRKKIK